MAIRLNLDMEARWRKCYSLQNDRTFVSDILPEAMMTDIKIQHELKNKCNEEENIIVQAVSAGKNGDHSLRELIKNIVSQQFHKCKNDANQFNAVYEFAKTRHMLDRYDYLFELPNEEQGREDERRRWYELEVLSPATLWSQYFAMPDQNARFSWAGRLSCLEAKMMYDAMQLILLHPGATFEEYEEKMSDSVTSAVLNRLQTFNRLGDSAIDAVNEIPEIDKMSSNLSDAIQGKVNESTGHRELDQSSGLDLEDDNKNLEIVNPVLQDLETVRQRIEKVGPVFTTGSLFITAFTPVNLVLDKMKTIGFGLPWKAVVKIIPQIAIIDKSFTNIQNGVDRLVEPTQTLRKLIPQVIEGVRARESGITDIPDLSGRVYLTKQLIPVLREDLFNLNSLIHNTCKTTEIICHSVDKLNDVKGIGVLSVNLSGGLSKLGQVLQQAEINNQDLLSAFDKTLQWLPNYHAKIRSLVTGSKLCQMADGGIFNKQTCAQSVTWFDDECEAICNKCKKSICDQHRVEVSLPLSQPARCSWLCLKCAAK